VFQDLDCTGLSGTRVARNGGRHVPELDDGDRDAAAVVGSDGGKGWGARATVIRDDRGGHSVARR